MRKRSTICTLYSAYMTLDDPRGASDPAETLRGPPRLTMYHDRYWPAQRGLHSPIHNTFWNRAERGRARTTMLRARVPHASARPTHPAHPCTRAGALSATLLVPNGTCEGAKRASDESRLKQEKGGNGAGFEVRGEQHTF